MRYSKEKYGFQLVASNEDLLEERTGRIGGKILASYEKDGYRISLIRTKRSLLVAEYRNGISDPGHLRGFENYKEAREFLFKRMKKMSLICVLL